MQPLNDYLFENNLVILHPPLFLIKFEFSKVGVRGDWKTGVPGDKRSHGKEENLPQT